MTTPNAVHHIAISTADMKSQIAFFSDVLGMSLQGLFWMHGVPNAWHAFLEMGDASFSFVFIPGNEEKETVMGQTTLAPVLDHPLQAPCNTLHLT